MKTFRDLVFRDHPNQFTHGKQGLIFFKNGYGASVVRFRYLAGFGNDHVGSYTSNDKEWELAVVRGSKKNYRIAYDTPITNDVLGHLSARQVTAVLKKIQLLPATI